MKQGLRWICLRVRPVLLGSGALFAGAAILLRGGEVARGIREGISLCLTSVIPSLFLVMVFADFLALTDAGKALFRPLYFLKGVFGVPGDAVPAILLSLIGGYPVGARMLARLVRDGRISPRTAERLLCCCVNCSPAFLIVGVALPCFGSVEIGAVMYGCQAASALLTGLLARLLWGKEPPFSASGTGREKVSQGLTQGFVSAVAEAGKGMGVICCFVLVFSVVCHGMAFLPGGEIWAGLLEVTVGCARLPGMPGMEMLVLGTVYTSLGGVCVWMQAACFLRGTGVRMRKFIFLRGVTAAVSLLLTVFCVKKLELPLPAFATSSAAVPAAGAATVGASGILVVLCLMLLLCRKSSGGNADS